MNLLDRDKNFVWHPYSHLTFTPITIPIVKGEGVYLIDEQGKRYIDAISSWWVNLFGHSHPYLRQKLNEQFEKLEHCIFAQFTHPPAVELAERLLHFCGMSLGKVFFSDNGSTAVEIALKMAIQAQQLRKQKRTKILALENAYHGDTFGAMSVSGESAFNLPFKDFMFEVITIPPPTPSNEDRCLSIIEKHKDDIIGFIYEPVLQGVAGMQIHSAETLRKIILKAQEHDIITIADEIFTGFYRTGKKLASEHVNVSADIICLSKGLTGGTMALGANVVSPKIVETFAKADRKDAFFHGHSYTANPLACSTALATLELLPSFLPAIEEISLAHETQMPIFENFGYFENVRNIGTMLAMEIQTPEGDGYFNTVRDKLYQHFIEQGVILRPLGNTIYILPPYCISAEELEKVYDAIISIDYRNIIA